MQGTASREREGAEAGPESARCSQAVRSGCGATVSGHSAKTRELGDEVTGRLHSEGKSLGVRMKGTGAVVGKGKRASGDNATGTPSAVTALTSRPSASGTAAASPESQTRSPQLLRVFLTSNPGGRERMPRDLARNASNLVAQTTLENKSSWSVSRP